MGKNRAVEIVVRKIWEHGWNTFVLKSNVRGDGIDADGVVAVAFHGAIRTYCRYLSKKDMMKMVH